MEELQGKHLDLSVDKPELLQRVAHALSSPVRLQIMQALGKRSMNVGELAQTLNIPMSTTALAVKTLEETGIITTETQPGARGAMKLCSRRIDTLSVTLAPAGESQTSMLVMQMPIGGYSAATGIRPTCGLAGDTNYIGEADDPSAFYGTGRFDAQIIWLRQGALEYRFSLPRKSAMVYDWLEISFEACSEAPMYRDPWKSDISVSLNGRLLGVWTSPCDCGGRRGKLTPPWWSELSTQFGFLKTWHVDAQGCFLDNKRISDVTLESLALWEGDFLSLRIEAAPDAANAGGLNLFGERFGDYAQPIVLRVGYHMQG